MASTSIGKLITIFTARTEGFVKGVNTAQRHLHKFGSASDAVRNKVAGLGSAIAAGLSVNAFRGFIAGQMEAIDAIAKLSDRLNIATEDLAGMQLHAELAGVGSDGLAKGLTILQKRVSEAAIGLGEAVEVFQKLGLSATQLSTMKADEQFRAIAEALERIPSKADRIRLAMGLMGRAGAPFVNMMMEGTDAFDDAARKAEEFGLAVSRVDAAQVEAANDAITEMKAAWDGIGRTIAVYLSPTIEALANQITESTVESRKHIDEMTDGLDPLARGYFGVIKAVAYFRDGISGLGMAWDMFYIGFVKTMEYLLRGFKKLIEGIVEVQKFLGLDVSSNNAALADYQTAIDNFATHAAEVADRVAEKFAQPTNVQKAEEAFADFLQKREDAVKGHTKRIEDAQKKADNDTLMAYLNAEKLKAELFRENNEKIVDLSDRLAEKQKDARERMVDGTRDSTEKIVNAYQRAYERITDIVKDEAREIEDLNERIAELTEQRDQDIDSIKNPNKKKSRKERLAEVEANYQKELGKIAKDRMQSLADRQQEYNSARAELSQELVKSLQEQQVRIAQNQESVQKEQLAVQKEMAKLLRERQLVGVAA